MSRFRGGPADAEGERQGALRGLRQGNHGAADDIAPIPAGAPLLELERLDCRRCGAFQREASGIDAVCIGSRAGIEPLGLRRVDLVKGLRGDGKLAAAEAVRHLGLAPERVEAAGEHGVAARLVHAQYDAREPGAGGAQRGGEGIRPRAEAARRLADWGCNEVCITDGSYGSLIYAEGEFFEIPAYTPTRVVDVTGCGDTYSTGYLYKRIQGAGYDESGRFAAAMSTLKLQSTGPFSQTEADVERVVRQAAAR